MFLLSKVAKDRIRRHRCVGFMVEPTVATSFSLFHFVNFLGEKKVL